jgi:formate hydrogenlyase transcriptional activator
MKDITAVREAEDKPRESEGELRQIMDFAPQQVAVLGPGRAILYLNQASLDYLGVTFDEFLSLDRRLLIHPDDRERRTGMARTEFSSGLQHESEIRLLRNDGNYRWFLFRYNPLRDEQGRIRRWVVTGTNIEDRKQAEQRLQIENIALREEVDRTSMYEEIVGTSTALRAVLPVYPRSLLQTPLF